jgi:hypothetical protein
VGRVLAACTAKLFYFKLSIAFFSAAEVVIAILAFLTAQNGYYSVAHISVPLYVPNCTGERPFAPTFVILLFP